MCIVCKNVLPELANFGWINTTKNLRNNQFVQNTQTAKEEIETMDKNTV